jgi:subtilisin family serine protease
MNEYIVTKDILNIRSSPSDLDASNFIGELKKGQTVFLTDELIVGVKPVGGETNIWRRDHLNNVMSNDGVRPKTYADKKLDFINDPFNINFFGNGDKNNEANWKVSWGHIDLEIWQLWKKGYRGQGVKVAVLDSGINTGVTDIFDAIKDKNTDWKSFNGGSTLKDDHGHGTICASILASRGQQMYGTAPECDLAVGKIRSKAKNFTPAIVLDALKWACEEVKADIISMSFSWNNPDRDIFDYIDKQSQSPNNKIFIAAVSDAGDLSQTLTLTPANSPGCISIASYTNNRIACTNSGWNPNLSYISPGDGLKAYNLAGVVQPFNCGTSYACPFTAGLFACLLSYYKTNNISYNREHIQEILDAPESTQLPLNYNRLQHGKGILNPLFILKQLMIS